MKPINFLIIAFCLIFSGRAAAQNNIFLSEGKIEFERRVNRYSNLEENDTWSELTKKAVSKFQVTYFDLIFSKGRTMYQPGRDNPDENKMYFFDDNSSSENVIYSQLDSSKSVSQKKVFEQIFLVEDSTRKIQWKITDETRMIAGFQCRRANAIIMDTVYVVAFYTDDIITSGGPESFNGLPGMILGISLPHKHVSWFATKVSAAPITASQFKNPIRGKKVTNASLRESLKESMKDWGKYQQRNLEAVML